MTSYIESLSNDTLNTIEDEFLSCILNQDRIIQIRNYIYRIDKENETVFALHVDKIRDYNDLLNENISNPNILKFSTEDDVFDLLNERINDEKALSKKCVGSQFETEGWEEYSDFTDVNNTLGGGINKRYKFKVWIKVRYDNWGINRKLFINFKHKEQAGGIWDETWVTIPYVSYYRNKDGSDIGSVSHLPLIPPNGTGITGYEFSHKEKEIPLYKGTKCLSHFSVRTWCWYRNRETGLPTLFPSNGCLRIFDGSGITNPC